MVNFHRKFIFHAKKILNRNFKPVNVDWLSRLDPYSRVFGLDRGKAIDRRFMEDFLQTHADDVRGKVLEIGDDQYSYKFGHDLIKTTILAGPTHSPRSDCFPEGNLTVEETLSAVGQHDCVIATNVLNFIYDLDSAMKGLASLVEPSKGVLIVTLAGLSQISRYDYDRWGDYWRFNDMSARRLFETYFGNVEVVAYGNAPLAAAFVMGLSQDEIPNSLFPHFDPDYQILIGIRATKPKSCRT